MMEAITHYAEQATNDLFVIASERDHWRDCLDDARCIAVLTQQRFGNWFGARALFSLPESLLGHPAPRREARKDVAPTLSARTRGGGGLGTDFDLDGGLIAADVAPTLTANGNKTGGDRPPGTDGDSVLSLIVMSSGQANAEIREDGGATTLTCLHEAPIVAHAFKASHYTRGKDYKARETDVAQPVMAGGPVGGNQGGDYVLQTAVRRLTPRECCRLQGFPDDYLDITYRGRPAADGPKYKALGNSMAVPVMAWIGKRIAMVDAIRPEAA